MDPLEKKGAYKETLDPFSDDSSEEDVSGESSSPHGWNCFSCGAQNELHLTDCGQCFLNRKPEKKDTAKKAPKVSDSKKKAKALSSKSKKGKKGEGGGKKSTKKKSARTSKKTTKTKKVSKKASVGQSLAESMAGMAGAGGGAGEVNVNLKWNEITLKEKVGSGRYGVVYRGTCRGHTVAVKVLDPSKVLEEKLESLATEVGIISSIRHPCVTLFMGVCTDDIEHVALVMEFIEGLSLDQLLKDKPGTLASRLLIAKDVAAGVNWLHRLDPPILHRDLKPANILVNNSTQRVKVCDFGLSCFKTYTVPENEDEIELAETAVGTPIWMAPEVLEGFPNTEKADVYAFGVILWQLLTLQEPWANETSYSTFLDKLIEDKERPRIPSPALPSMKKLIRDCWAPEPKDRPDFGDVIPRIEEVYIDTAISDPAGREVWRTIGKRIRSGERFSRFAVGDRDPVGKHYPIKVPFDVFYDTFRGTALAGPGEDEVPDEMAQLVMLPFLPDLREGAHFAGDGAREVSAEKWGNFLTSFGPLVGLEQSFITRLFDLCKRPWFHGNVSKEIAEQRLLTTKRRGYFLVRLSTTGGPGTFAISRLAKVDKVHHYRVHRDASGSFEISLSNQIRSFSSLVELVESKTRGLKRQLKLKFPCPGSMLLASSPIGQYVSTSVDEVKKYVDSP